MKYGTEFWSSTAERTVATGAQTAAALLGADGLGLLQVDWKALASATGMAMLLAILKALAAGASDGNPSLGSHEVVATPGAQADPVGEVPVEVVPADEAISEGHDAGEYNLDDVQEVPDDGTESPATLP